MPRPHPGRIARALGGFMSSIRGSSRPAAHDDFWYGDAGAMSHTGKVITPNTAMGAAAVFACVRAVSETMATLPAHVFKDTPGGGKEKQITHPVHRILSKEPNPELTRVEFLEKLFAWVELQGNAYAEIERDTTGRIMALWPLRPDRMLVCRRGKEIVYTYQLPNGQHVLLGVNDILHLRFMPIDGLVGISPIGKAREAVGLAVAAEEYGARYFAGDGTPRLALSTEQKLTKDAQKLLAESWSQTYGGLTNAHRVAILEQGLKPTSIGLRPRDAEWIASRRFQLEEIARMYRVPPSIVGDHERSTYSNVEQQAIAWVQNGVLPRAVRYEAAIDKWLLGADSGLYAKFELAGLLRGDTAARFAAYESGIMRGGWLSRNEARAFEDLNPVDGLDDMLVPLNMMVVGDEPEPEPEPEPVVEPDVEPEPDEDESADAEGKTREWAERSTIERRNVAKFRGQWRSVLYTAIRRMVKRENAMVLEAARKHLEERSAGTFDAWLEEFERDFPKIAAEIVGPAIESYMGASADYAADGIDEDAPDISAFIESYIDTYVNAHTGKTAAQIRQIMDESDADDALGDIEQRVDEWDDTRADKDTNRETSQAGEAAKLAALTALGITAFRWVANADACPLCEELDGQVVGVEKAFVPAGGNVEAEGSNTLTTESNVFHPPLHGGCGCSVVPD